MIFSQTLNSLKWEWNIIRKTHYIPVSYEAKVFDDVAEGKKLMEVASHTKGNLFDEFSQLIEKVEIIDELC